MAWLPGAARIACAPGVVGLEDSNVRCWRGAPSVEGEMRPAFLRLRSVAQVLLFPAAGTGMRDGVMRLLRLFGGEQEFWGEVKERARDLWP